MLRRARTLLPSWLLLLSTACEEGAAPASTEGAGANVSDPRPSGEAAPAPPAALGGSAPTDPPWAPGDALPNGAVESLRYLEDGSRLLTGQFTTLGAKATPGRAFVDASGVFTKGPAPDGVDAFSAAVAELDATGAPTGRFLATTTARDQKSARLVRLLADGRLDSTFAAPTCVHSGYASLRSVTIHHDGAGNATGKVFVLARCDTYGGAVVPHGVVRLHGDGSLDTSYRVGTGGLSPNDWPTGVVEERAAGGAYTGRVFLIGTVAAYDDTPTPGLVIRLAANGTLDGTWSPPAAASLGRAAHVVPELDAAGVATGRTLMAGPFGVVRLMATGERDASFVAPGTRFGRSLVAPEVTAAGPTTKLLAALVDVDKHRLVRLFADGAVDPSFAGKEVEDAEGGFLAYVRAIVPDVDGAGVPTGRHLVVSTAATYGGAPVPRGVFRIEADGSLDASFGADEAGLDVEPEAILPLRTTTGSSGRYLAVGAMATAGGRRGPAGVGRIRPDGTVDEAFLSQRRSSRLDRVYGVVEGRALDGKPSGHFMLFGSLWHDGKKTGLFRVDTTGVVDAAFTPPPWQEVELLTPAWSASGQPSGGWLALAEDGLVRLLPSGAVDPSFQLGVRGAASYVEERDAADRPTGAVFVAGSDSSFPRRYAIARTLSDGTVDASFHSVGKGFDEPVTAMALDYAPNGGPTGKLLVAHRGKTYDGQPVGPIVRLSASGALDPTFTSEAAEVPVPTELVHERAPNGAATGRVYARVDWDCDPPGPLVRLLPSGARDRSFAIAVDLECSGPTVLALERTATGTFTGNLLLGDAARGGGVRPYLRRLGPDGKAL